MTNDVLHFPHLALFPAVSSAVVKTFWHLGQVKRMAIATPSLSFRSCGHVADYSGTVAPNTLARLKSFSALLVKPLLL
jgi:hypothetical protein